MISQEKSPENDYRLTHQLITITKDAYFEIPSLRGTACPDPSGKQSHHNGLPRFSQ